MKLYGWLTAAVLGGGSALAQGAAPEYTRAEAMIPVRDGAKLHAVILRPAGSETSGEPLPFLMQRTPYGVDGVKPDGVAVSKPELAASGYIFVYEDIRGRYGSEGQFVMNRPIVPHKSKTDVDETTDTRDTIDWLLKNVAHNSGKVGVLGVSYPGFLAISAGIDAHPAVKAISPQAPMTDVWLGDDFFHNGAFRETYGFDYTQQLEGQKTDVRVESQDDLYDFFLRNGNFAGAVAAAKIGDLPTAKIFLTQPTYTKFWQDMAVERRLTKVEVPTLEVGGYWDQEDMWGPQAEYAALKPHDAKHEVFLVLGPWNHGGWGGPAQTLGVVDFGEPTGDEYRKTFEAPFFEKYLKDRAGFELKDTASFRSGANTWQRYESWPPKAGFSPARMYLLPDKKLSLTAPTGAYDAVAAAYVADPADPIPYRSRPIQPTYGTGSKWRTWLAEDQRFVSGRKDLANFSTQPLDRDMTVTGDIVADLFAATTGTDADWVVKLIDVYPDGAPAPMAGYELMVAEEIFRGRYRKSFERPEAVAPGEIAEYKYSLHGADHTFLKGHKVMVEVQSSWFPLYDRNPQTFVPNIMSAPANAYKAATMSDLRLAEIPLASGVPNPGGTVSEMMRLLLALQLFHVLFLLLHDWVPLGTLNDPGAVRRANPGATLVRTTILSALPYVVGMIGTAAAFGKTLPQWLLTWLWVSYALLFLGELRAWWIPNLLIRDPARAERYRTMFGKTHSFLPEHNGIRPNTLHLILHGATLMVLVVLASIGLH